MKGFIITSKIAGESDMLEVALPYGIVTVSFEINRDAHMMGIGGYDILKDTHISWFGTNIQLGDEINIEFAEIEESPLPVWQETHSSLVERMVAVSKKDDEEVWQHKLDLYYRLKAILESENLI